MKRDLLIFGDSWGCGEWSYQTGRAPFIAHPGISQYLSDEFQVKNFSREGASLWQIAYALRNYLENLRRLPTRPLPLIMVMQTDAARDQQADKFDVDYDTIYRSGTGIRDIYQQILEIWYIKLQLIADQYDTDIYVCGGLTDVDVETLHLYPRLKCLCQSWIQLCEPSINSSIMPLIMSPHVLQYLHDNHDPVLTGQMLDWLDSSFLSLQTLLESDWMGPSYGDYHPSRQAHQVLSTHIKDFFNREQQ